MKGAKSSNKHAPAPVSSKDKGKEKADGKADDEGEKTGDDVSDPQKLASLLQAQQQAKIESGKRIPALEDTLTQILHSSREKKIQMAPIMQLLSIAALHSKLMQRNNESIITYADYFQRSSIAGDGFRTRCDTQTIHWWIAATLLQSCTECTNAPDTDITSPVQKLQEVEDHDKSFPGFQGHGYQHRQYTNYNHAPHTITIKTKGGGSTTRTTGGSSQSGQSNSTTPSKSGGSTHGTREPEGKGSHKSIQCYNCHGYGHTAKNCRKPKMCGFQPKSKGKTKKSQSRGGKPESKSGSSTVCPAKVDGKEKVEEPASSLPSSAAPTETKQTKHAFGEKTSCWLSSLLGKVNGKPVTLMIDSCSSISVISEDALKHIVPNAEVTEMPSLVKAEAINDTLVELWGRIDLQLPCRLLILLLITTQVPINNWKVGEHLTSQQKEELISLLNSNCKVFATCVEELREMKGIEHENKLTSNIPINNRCHTANPAKRELEKQEVQKLLDTGVARWSKSPYSVPVVLVKKKDGSIHVFPMPDVTSTTHLLGENRWWSKLDAYSGYWQVKVKEEDIPKTAFSCALGHLEMVHMPFGKQWQYILTYIDDIIVFSHTFEEHMQHLQEVFNCLNNTGVRLKHTKCEFCMEKINFLALYPFHTIQWDHAGSFGKKATANGNRFILNVIDVFLNYWICIPTPNEESATTAKLLWEHVFELHTFMNMVHNVNAPYRPQTIGRVEQVNSVLRRALKKAGDKSAKWDQIIPALTNQELRVLLAILAVDGAPIAALFETHHVLLASDLATNLIGTVDDVTARTNLADRHLCRILWEIFASYADHTTAHCFFIQAKAGCGKTFLAQYLLSSLRLEHQLQDQFYDNLPEDIQLELDQAGYVATAAHFQFPQAQNP
ncbi:Transposon Ty3-I Gag-Pol poly [Pelomyxa schiedti]|nr:Transposon Ty3-I Gag-Pol poly [Pelomyxa schiedti]